MTVASSSSLESRGSNIQILEKDALLTVFEYLDLDSLMAVSNVCENWRKVLDTPEASYRIWDKQLPEQVASSMFPICLEKLQSMDLNSREKSQLVWRINEQLKRVVDIHDKASEWMEAIGDKVDLQALSSLKRGAEPLLGEVPAPVLYLTDKENQDNNIVSMIYTLAVRSCGGYYGRYRGCMACPMNGREWTTTLPTKSGGTLSFTFMPIGSKVRQLLMHYLRQDAKPKYCFRQSRVPIPVHKDVSQFFAFPEGDVPCEDISYIENTLEKIYPRLQGREERILAFILDLARGNPDDLDEKFPLLSDEMKRRIMARMLSLQDNREWCMMFHLYRVSTIAARVLQQAVGLDPRFLDIVDL